MILHLGISVPKLKEGSLPCRRVKIPWGLLNNYSFCLLIRSWIPESHTKKNYGSVQKGRSSKGAAAWTGGAYEGVREHGQGARTQLAAFSNNSTLDPVVLEKGKAISIVGEILGSETILVGEEEKKVPVFRIKDLTVWVEAGYWGCGYSAYGWGGGY